VGFKKPFEVVLVDSLNVVHLRVLSRGPVEELVRDADLAQRHTWVSTSMRRLPGHDVLDTVPAELMPVDRRGLALDQGTRLSVERDDVDAVIMGRGLVDRLEAAL
jgi:hypothetical protein